LLLGATAKLWLLLTPRQKASFSGPAIRRQKSSSTLKESGTSQDCGLERTSEATDTAGRLLRYVLAEADKEGKTVTVSLDTDNPDLARKKYISLGFTTKGSTRNHYMIRIPSKHP